jgi:hypothetical protein
MKKSPSEMLYFKRPANSEAQNKQGAHAEKLPRAEPMGTATNNFSMVQSVAV